MVERSEFTYSAAESGRDDKDHASFSQQLLRASWVHISQETLYQGA